MLCVFRFATLVRRTLSLSPSLTHTHSLTVPAAAAAAALLLFTLCDASLLRRCCRCCAVDVRCWLFAILLLARSLGHMSNAPRFRVFCFTRDFLLYFTFALRYIHYVTFLYVTFCYCLLNAFYLFFISFLLVFCFCALLLISCFYFDSPTRFYCSRSVVYLCFYLSFSCSLLSLSLSFSYFCHCLLIGARAAGSGKLN